MCVSEPAMCWGWLVSISLSGCIRCFPLGSLKVAGVFALQKLANAKDLSSFSVSRVGCETFTSTTLSSDSTVVAGKEGKHVKL